MTNKQDRLLKQLIRESVLLELGSLQEFKSTSPRDVRKRFPKFYDYLVNAYSEHLSGAIFALRRSGFLGRDIPYVLFPRIQGTIIYWLKDKPVFASSLTTARAIMDSNQ